MGILSDIRKSKALEAEAQKSFGNGMGFSGMNYGRTVGQGWQYPGSLEALFYQMYGDTMQPFASPRFGLTDYRLIYEKIAPYANAIDIKRSLIRKPVIWWDREVFTHTAQTQYDGKALTNPVNGLYDDLVESERSRAVMVVEWNVQYGYSIAEYTERWDQAVNNSGWTFLGKTYDPRQVVVREVSSGKVVTEGSYNYYKARMRLAIAAKNETWDEPIPQLARHYFTKSSSASFDEEPGQAGVYKRTAAPDLVPVNDDGTRRPDNQPILVRKVRARKEENFTQLPFVALV